MSAHADLAAVVRHCDTGFLDTRHDMLADPGDIAGHLYAAVRTEVLAEVEARLATMTREADQQTEAMENEGADSASMMYAQHIGLRRARDAVRRMVGEEATPAGATATPDFFRPRRTYTVRGFTYQCENTTTHPAKGEREAWGWLHRGGDLWRLERLYEADYTADVAQSGSDRG